VRLRAARCSHIATERCLSVELGSVYSSIGAQRDDRHRSTRVSSIHSQIDTRESSVITFISDGRPSPDVD